jgi:OmpA-OmpF porin, OOP family
MSLKQSLALTTAISALATVVACQASFQAGAGSGPAPTNTANTVANAPASAPAPAIAESAIGGQVNTASVPPTASGNSAVAGPAPVVANTKLAGGKIVAQGSLAWDSGKAILLSTSENDAILNDLRLFLDQNPKITQMRIEGHTDNVGSSDANLELSGQRALTVRKALIEKGVAKERLIAVGFGDKKPLGDNATEAGRAKNQRIEFKVATWEGKDYLKQPPNGGGKTFE